MNQTVKIFSTLLLLILCFGCKNSDLSLTDQIGKMEKAYAKNPNVDNANKVIELYGEFTKSNPNDVEENGRLLQKTAQLYLDNEEYIKSAGTLVLAIKKFYGSSSTEQSILNLSNIYKENLNNPEAAIATLNGFLIAFPNAKEIENITTELGDNLIDPQEHIVSLAQRIFETPDGSPGFDREAAEKYIGHSEIYALTNGGNPEMATDLLMKAASVARTAGNFNKALEFYQWISQSFPDSEEGPKAIFLTAFTLDNDMGKKEEARVLYQKFIDNYPEHHFADDAGFQLENLGKSSSEIIESFEKTNPSTQ